MQSLFLFFRNQCTEKVRKYKNLRKKITGQLICMHVCFTVGWHIIAHDQLCVVENPVEKMKYKKEREDLMGMQIDFERNQCGSLGVL